MRIIIGKSSEQLSLHGFTEKEFFFSVEAGRHDGVQHFDHHGAHEGQTCPCNNGDIVPIAEPDCSVIGVTHMDADTFVGLLRMVAQKSLLPLHAAGVDLALMARYDVKATGLPVGLNPTKCFMLWVTAQGMKLPRPPTEGVTDITEQVMSMVARLSDLPQCLFTGQVLGEKAETLYKERLEFVRETAQGRKLGFWSLRDGETMDPTRPYQDGYQLVVVYRQQHQSASLYADDSVEESLPGRYAGVLFEGHPHACGSERGKTFLQDQIHLAVRQVEAVL